MWQAVHQHVQTYLKYPLEQREKIYTLNKIKFLFHWQNKSNSRASNAVNL